jgi:hypothetical protein
MSDEILARLERLEDMQAVLVERPTSKICGGRGCRDCCRGDQPKR